MNKQKARIDWLWSQQ